MTSLLLFTVFSAAGASFPIGYTGYIPYGMIIWVMMGVGVHFLSKAPSHSPITIERKSGNSASVFHSGA